MIGDRLYRYPPIALPKGYAEAERGYAGALLTNGIQGAYFCAQHQNNLVFEQVDRLDQIVIGNREIYGAGTEANRIVIGEGIWEPKPGFDVIVGRAVIVASRPGLFRMRVVIFDGGVPTYGDWNATRIAVGTQLPYFRGIGSQGAHDRPLDVFDIFPDSTQIVEAEVALPEIAATMAFVWLEAYCPAVEGDPDPASVSFTVLYRHAVAESIA